MGEFRMPSLGADMERGTLLEWRVKPGDPVTRGDIIAVVDTEKSTIEIEVFEDGVVDSIVVPEGEEVPVGAVLAIIRSGTATATPVAPAAPAAPAVPPPAPVAVPAHGIVISPVVRHLAERLDVDLDTVAATGPGARVTRADVERAAAPATPSPPPFSSPLPTVIVGPGDKKTDGRPRFSPYARRLARERGVDLAGVRGSGPAGAVVARDVPAATAPVDRAARLRHRIAELMARSKREIPHYYLRTTIDLSAAMTWLEARNATASVTDRLLPAALLVKAVARAARAVPGLNGTWTDDGVVMADHVHVGVVVSLRGGGVIAPALHDVDTLAVDDVMAQLRDVVTRARGGSLRASEMADPTITVTDLGDQGVDEVFGVIYPPQVALVGFGTVRDQPWVVDGRVEVRPVVVVTLAADHRACDGRLGAKFLNTIDQLLQKPEAL